MTDSCRRPLDKEWLANAKDELHEDEKERDSAIESLRSWALQQKWLKTPTDDWFMLWFLRKGKFSQLAARDSLVHFWTTRTKHRHWFGAKYGTTDPAVLELIKTGFYVYTKGVDKNGRRLLIERPGVLKIKDIKKKYGLDIVFRAIMCVVDVLSLDERVQVNGFNHLYDGHDAGTDMLQVYNLTNFQNSMPVFQKSFPNRIKTVNIYRITTVFEAILRVVISLMSDKLSKRTHLHGKSLVSVYNVIDKNVLPTDYLPDDYEGPNPGSLQDCIDNMVADFTNPEVDAHVRRLNSDKYGIDFDLKSKSDIPLTSFRKLNVD